MLFLQWLARCCVCEANILLWMFVFVLHTKQAKAGVGVWEVELLVVPRDRFRASFLPADVVSRMPSRLSVANRQCVMSARHGLTATAQCVVGHDFRCCSSSQAISRYGRQRGLPQCVADGEASRWQSLTLLMLRYLVLHCQYREHSSRAHEPLIGTMDLLHPTSILTLALCACVKATSTAIKAWDQVCSHEN